MRKYKFGKGSLYRSNLTLRLRTIFLRICDLYGIKSLIRVPTCYKNPANPTCIDLMLTNSNRSFQNSCTIETGLSDFHKMIVSVLQIYFQKREAKVINYWDYRNFSNEEFRQQVPKDNHSPFINKTILKAIMDRSRLRIQFLKTRSNEVKRAYKTQKLLFNTG